MSDLYYQHSGKFPGAGLVAAILGGAAAAVMLSFAYAYLLLYIPLAGYVTIILTGGFGFLLGFVTAWLLKRGKVRNIPVSMVAMAVVGAVGFYSAWVVWIYAVLRREDFEADLLSLFLNPSALWSVILLVNNAGAWTVRNWSPTGGVLWGFWALEAAIIFGAAFVVCFGAMKKEAFCEGCGTWCEETAGVARLGQAEAAELKQHLEMRDFAYLEKLGPAKGDAGFYVELDLHSCPNCRMTHTLSASLVTITVNKKGESEAKKDSVADKLLLDSSGVDAIRALGQKFKPTLDVAATPAK